MINGYFPFGLCRISQGNLAIDRQFTGQILDATGLYYYNARYYDPTIGRFISADSAAPDLQNPQSLNKYSYCFNNPLNQTDPTGHFSWKTALKIAAIVVVVAVVMAVAIIAAPIVLTAIAGAASAVAMTTSVAAVATVAEGVSSVALTCAGTAAAIATPIAAAVPTLAAATTAATTALVGGGEYPYTVEEGDVVNRVYDVKGGAPYQYSGLTGGSYCPGNLNPVSASQQILTRGLNPSINGADMGAVLQATQDIPATLITSIGGINPEIVIDRQYWDYLELMKTFQNKP